MPDASPSHNGQPAHNGLPAEPSSDDHSRLRASALVERFAAAQKGETVRLGDLLGILDDRAFGMLILLMTLPNIIPLPGLSTATGIPIILLGLQLTAGAHRPWLPRRLADVTLPRDGLLKVLDRVHPVITRIEKHMRPRALFLCEGWGERLAGLAVAILAAVMALPIVFGNLPPAAAIAIISIGLIEKDGAMVAAGLLTGVAALAFVSAIVFGLGEALALVAHSLTTGN